MNGFFSPALPKSGNFRCSFVNLSKCLRCLKGVQAKKGFSVFMKSFEPGIPGKLAVWFALTGALHAKFWKCGLQQRLVSITKRFVIFYERNRHSLRI